MWLFDLKMALESYDHFQGQLAAYEEHFQDEHDDDVSAEALAQAEHEFSTSENFGI